MATDDKTAVLSRAFGIVFGTALAGAWVYAAVLPDSQVAPMKGAVLGFLAGIVLAVVIQAGRWSTARRQRP